MQRATGRLVGGAVAAALLMLNPDVLYLQSTPMTEPLLFGTTFLAIALIARVGDERRAATAPPKPRFRRADRRQWRRAGRASRRASRATKRGRSSRRRSCWRASCCCGAGGRSCDALRAVRGLALWPLWALAAFLVNSKVTVGAWFVSTGFFIAENPALGHPLAGVACRCGMDWSA